MSEHSSIWRDTVGILLLALLVAGCGDSGTGQGAVVLVVGPSSTLMVGIGSFTTLTVSTEAGNFVDPGEVDWSSAAPGVATVADRGLVRAQAGGIAHITARWSGSSATALIEVWIPVEVDPSADGTSFLGRKGYVEYLPGTLPFILSAPHGGALTPAEIPDRTFGVTLTDRNTERMAEQIRDAFIARTEAAPHVIISRLARIKLDPNREIVEAAQGSPFAENAWDEFHGFIETARAWVENELGSGLYVDLHGHGHEVNRLELGYLTSGTDLDVSNGVLDAGNFAPPRVRSRRLYRAREGPSPSCSEVRPASGRCSRTRESRRYPARPTRRQPEHRTSVAASTSHAMDHVIGARSAESSSSSTSLACVTRRATGLFFRSASLGSSRLS